MAFLHAAGIDKSYQVASTRLPVLRGLDLVVEQGEMVAIVGASGVGKSTLLHVLGGLDVVDAGTIRIGDADLATLKPDALTAFRNRHVGFVFQFHHLLPEFTAAENTGMPMRIARRPAAEREARAMAMLERVGLAGRVSHNPGMLSGGEQQRVAIARALVTAPDVLLADELTAELDHVSRQRVLDRVFGLAEAGSTVVLCTHDPELASSCHREIHLTNGTVTARR